MSKAVNHPGSFQADAHAALQGHRLTKAIEASVKAGAGHYKRARHLPGLIGIDPGVLPDTEAMPKKVIVARLEQALRAERRRARAGHWAYDLNRHIALRQALMAEENDRSAGLDDRIGNTERTPSN